MYIQPNESVNCTTHSLMVTFIVLESSKEGQQIFLEILRKGLIKDILFELGYRVEIILISKTNH